MSYSTEDRLHALRADPTWWSPYRLGNAHREALEENAERGRAAVAAEDGIHNALEDGVL